MFHRNKTQNNLVLITHPEHEKNYGISSTFEKFVKKHKDDKLLASIMNGQNESEDFKKPIKLPAVVYFKRDGDDKVSLVELDRLDLIKSFDSKDKKVN